MSMPARILADPDDEVAPDGLSKLPEPRANSAILHPSDRGLGGRPTASDGSSRRAGCAPRCICCWWPVRPDPDDHVHSAAVAAGATIMLSAGNRSGSGASGNDGGLRA